MSPEAFVDRWSGREGGAERANYALFLTELTQALDLPPPEPADSRSIYRFEFPVRGKAGQPLRIDLYKKDAFILEAKQSRWAGTTYSEGKNEAPFQPNLFNDPDPAPRMRRSRWDADMRAAFNQAWDYANRLPADHDRPPFQITCDVGSTFEFYSDFTGQGRAYRAFPSERQRVVALHQLLEHDVQELFHAVWTKPRGLDPATKRAQATRDVAGYLAEVSKALEGRGHAPEEVAGFLARLLFAMFAEDVGLLKRDSFTDLLKRCLDSPSSFMPQAEDLFRRMDEGGFSPGLGESVRRFNGAFYKDRRAFPLQREEIGTLILAAEKDWKQVEPAIFGTLLEQALNPKERARLGAHYTPRPYVERLVQATVMEPLRADWDAARAAAEDKQAHGDIKGAQLELLAFHDELTRTRVLDPACGTGNFLYVTLELMKALESEVLDARAGLLTDEDEDLISDAVKRGVDPRQFLGLELNPRAASIAELVLWIGYLQASFRRDPDYNPRDPVLSDFRTINPEISKRYAGDTAVDAILQSDGDVVGGGGVAYPNARRPAWPEAEFVVGNPPFVRGSELRREMGDEYAEALWRLNPEMSGQTDLVMYWWDRSAEILLPKGSRLRRFGLVTTNKIAQEFNRRVVERHQTAKVPLSLVWAVDDHPWYRGVQGAAQVRIAMTVAARGELPGELNVVVRQDDLGSDAPDVELAAAYGRINADLTVGTDVTKATKLRANAGLCHDGVKLHGRGFGITRAEAEHLGLGRADRAGLEEYIRPYRNGRDLAQRSRDRWVIDLFGLRSEQVRDAFPEVYQHLLLTVRPERQRVAAGSTSRDVREYADKWWIFGKPRQELRPALEGLRRYIGTVDTSPHRVFQFVPSEIIVDDAVVVIASNDPAVLAVLSSDLHVQWSLRAGGWLGVGNDPRYFKSRTFDPFPFPTWTDAQRTGLGEAGEALDAFRKRRLAETPDLTLTRLYNALGAWRAGRHPDGEGAAAMTPQQAADFEAGSVLVLAEFHDRIDRLTLEAYGWSDLEPRGDTEALLGRLVALNAERAAEEARGEVRWLRPEYQLPRFARAEVAGPQAAGDLVGQTTTSTKADRVRWSGDVRAKLMLLRGALAEAPAPQRPEDLAARFSGRGVGQEVQRLLGTLQRDGQVRRSPAGYELLRAA